MKNKKIISLITMVAMTISAIALVTPAISSPAQVSVDPMLITEQVRHRIESANPSWDLSGIQYPSGSQASSLGQNFKISSTTSVTSATVGDHKLFWLLDDYFGTYRLATFTLFSQGNLGEVWVQDNLNWPAGDPRSNSLQVVTQAQTDLLLGEFENNIFAKDTAFYGTPAVQDGSNANFGAPYGLPDSASLCAAVGLDSSYCDYSDASGRQLILIENVRDDQYYDPTYPNYIAGFYSSTFDSVFDRNTMTIDSYDWANRIGGEGSRPYVYESTFAHEYQHLIHADYVSGDSTFINEGFSMYAEYLCGYGVDYGYVNAYFAQPWNSLTEWGDLGGINILGDYGEAMLFIHYVENHYPGFQSKFMQNGVPGVAGIEQAVADVMGHKAHSHHQVTFDQLFNNFHLANVIQAKWGPYSYSSIDFSQANPLNVQSFVDNAATGSSNTYGTNYYLVDGLNGKYDLTFSGDIYSSVPQDPGWTIGSDGFWYSGTGDEVDRAIFGSAYVDPANPTLSFYTEYIIEEGWDFGLVQVSTDNGATWTSQSNSYTTSDHADGAYPAIIDQLPGLTGGPVTDTMTFDLSAYAGQTVLFQFRYMTDWSFNEVGWYIDSNSVTVSGTHVDLTTVAPPPPPSVDWTVTVVAGLHLKKGDQSLFNWNLRLDSAQTGSQSLTFFNNKFISNYYIVVVTPNIEAGSAGFQLNLDQVHPSHHNH
jgi:hypothetical protein